MTKLRSILAAGVAAAARGEGPGAPARRPGAPTTGGPGARRRAMGHGDGKPGLRSSSNRQERGGKGAKEPKGGKEMFDKSGKGMEHWGPDQLFYLLPAACPNECVSSHVTGDHNEFVDSLKPCVDDDESQMWLVRSDGSYVVIESYHERGMCIAVDYEEGDDAAMLADTCYNGELVLKPCRLEDEAADGTDQGADHGTDHGMNHGTIKGTDSGTERKLHSPTPARKLHSPTSAPTPTQEGRIAVWKEAFIALDETGDKMVHKTERENAHGVEWYFTGGQLVNSLCWGAGLSSVMTVFFETDDKVVNECRKDVAVWGANDEAVLKADTFLFVNRLPASPFRVDDVDDLLGNGGTDEEDGTGA